MTASPAPETSLEEEFVSTTSLHGIARVANNTRTIFRLAWLLIMVVFLGVCIAQVTDRLQRFFMYKANTAISVEYVGDLDFPAVTICNFNRYRLSKLTASDLRALSYILAANDYDYDQYGDYSSSSLSFSDSYPLDDDNSSTAFNYTDFTLRAGFVLDDVTLLDCKWRGKNDSCSAANFSHVFTSFGNCWTFNSGSDGEPIVKEIQPGAGNGLRMTIDIQQHEYSESPTGNIEAGLKVLVHDQNTPPMIDSQGFAVQPGVHAFVAIRKQQFLNLEHPYGKCDASKELTRFPKYTLEGCNIECRTQKILDICNCRLVRHPGTEVECTPKQTNGCARDVLSKLRSGELPACECSIPCNYTTFSNSLSTAAIPSQQVAQQLIDQYNNLQQYTTNTSGSASYSSVGYNPQLLDSTYMENNWIVLDVFYVDINFQLYEQSEAISPSALISDIGGQLGLFLGASFITLTEILSYFGRKLGRLLAIRKPRKSAPALGVRCLQFRWRHDRDMMQCKDQEIIYAKQYQQGAMERI